MSTQPVCPRYTGGEWGQRPWVGRFWYGRGRMVIAPRFPFRVTCGVDALDQVTMPGHPCDSSRVGPGLVAWLAAPNRRE
jgi:hypothetical protein